ncbi:carboxymuconolactone decarboxylase family protein [Rivihabitans pingtungensis]|jgi:AhpD family alkylhydroperoxidase|uniref:AhpD family alkylhydroperoxidase n=1 Tax=Rivihabitans pingtungensis TaxID=1054498 RepID=A0A318L201_9NEIS|nr:carboxymuconolactone decarboxylase family protein [Rivihabitans pingtungensis]PXX74463.1 AhpD family alkylhydroperoxidase [Rivihabitans pingtungensis]
MPDYRQLTQGISSSMAGLRQDIPEVMKGFSALAHAATQNGALDKKTKELIALAIGVAVRCDGCIGFHMQALLKLGASKAEIEETLGMAVYMGGGPSLMYAAHAMQAYDQMTAD